MTPRHRADTRGLRWRSTFAALSGLLVSVASLPALAQLPALVMDEAQDQACAQDHHTPIDPAWTAELRSLLPQADALWQSQAPGMFAEVARLTRGRVTPQPVPIRLTLCGVPSHSTPEVVINMRHVLRSFTPQPVQLQKATLLALGQPRELAQLIGVDEQLPSGCYRHAWSIVNDQPETYLTYMRELAGHD